MKRRWALYGEVTPGHGFRRRNLDEELLTLWALDVRLAEDLRSLFEEAATDTLSDILGESGARAVVMQVGAKSFRSPSRLFRALDSVFREGSEVLKVGIAEEFRASVHLLWEKAKRNSVGDSPFLAAPMAKHSSRAKLRSANPPRDREAMAAVEIRSRNQ
jgi:hypothetical protein